MNKTNVKINMSVYLGMSLLDKNLIAMYDNYWYDDVKPKYRRKSRIFYTYTDIFIIHIKSEDM